MGLFDRFFRKPLAPPPKADALVPAKGREIGPVAPRRRKVHSIHRQVVDVMAQMGRANHPNEYGAALRAEKGVITELVLVPGMIGGGSHTFMNTWHLPIDPSLVGTVHSHPSPYPIPSDADRQFFGHFGHTHLIIAYPYNAYSWRAYDLTAEPVKLDVVDEWPV